MKVAGVIDMVAGGNPWSPALSDFPVIILFSLAYVLIPTKVTLSKTQHGFRLDSQANMVYPEYKSTEILSHVSQAFIKRGKDKPKNNSAYFTVKTGPINFFHFLGGPTCTKTSCLSVMCAKMD